MRRRGRFARRIDDFGDIAEPHRRAVAIGDDDVAKARGVENLVVGIEGDHPMRTRESALWSVDGCRGQRDAHVFETDAARRQLAGIDLHVHGIGFLTKDAGFRDPVDRRYLLRQDRVGVLVDLVDRHRVGMDRIDQNRPVRRVGLAVGRRGRQILRKNPARGVDRRQHVLRGGVDIALELELQRDHHRAHTARRAHLGEARDGGELLLERGRDGRRHRLRAGAGIIDRHRYGRKIDLGQCRHREEAIGADSEHQDPEHHQRCRDRTPNKGFRNTHPQ